MADVLSPQQRSYCMSQIRGKDTKPEQIVRQLVHRMGFRFRKHGPLPGRPDVVLTRHRKLILVHGCYWHLHNCRYGRVTPKTNTEFWQSKREGNRQRDRRTMRTLKRLGWKVLVVWECQTRDTEKLKTRLGLFLQHAD